MRSYVQITLHFFYFFIFGKKEDYKEHLKEKNDTYRGKLQKEAGRMRFVIASKENSQLMSQWPFLC